VHGRGRASQARPHCGIRSPEEFYLNHGVRAVTLSYTGVCGVALPFGSEDFSMRGHHSFRLALALAAVVSAAPVAAALYKWVDERGVTHYSDKKPDDPKSSDKVKTVAGNLSVYSPDKSLLQAVEVARVRASQPPAPEPFYRAPLPYAAPMSPQPPVE